MITNFRELKENIHTKVQTTVEKVEQTIPSHRRKDFIVLAVIILFVFSLFKIGIGAGDLARDKGFQSVSVDTLLQKDIKK